MHANYPAPSSHGSDPPQRLHEALFGIAERASAGLSLYDFLADAHVRLQGLLEARNFYVALLAPHRQSLNFPYYVDERDGDTMQCDDVPLRKGLTEFVLRTGEPQLIDAARFVALQASGDITEATGDLTFSAWLGVPFWLGGLVGGALVVQTYDEGGSYSPADVEVLAFLARQFGSMVERHQALQSLRDSEARYRMLFEHLGVGVAVVQAEHMVFANPALHRMLGRSQGELVGTRFSEHLHPDDVTEVKHRDRLRLAGEAPNQAYLVRAVWSDGQQRQLEVSAGVIPWGTADATAVMVVDVTAKVEAEQSAQLAMEREREMTRMKARFMAMASHEFRTPLTSISGALDMLTHYADRLQPPEKAEALAAIRRAVHRMTAMVDGVIRADVDQHMPWQFQPEPVLFDEMWHRLMLEVQLDGLAEGRQIRLQGEAGVAGCVLDESLLRHIVTNLCSNALKYSPVHQPIEIDWAWQDGMFQVQVSDRGIGIGEADASQLFEPYHRGSNVGSVAGVGLGLQVVQQAVGCHAGTLTWHRREGGGTRFTVWLPAPHAAG